MRKCCLTLLLCALLIVPAAAQTTSPGASVTATPAPTSEPVPDCSAAAMNARMDDIYAAYRRERDNENPVEARDDLLNLQTALLALLETCTPARTGRGAAPPRSVLGDLPVPPGELANAGGVLLRVVDALRPADGLILAANMFNPPPLAGQEYVQMSLEVLCDSERTVACDVTPFHFRLETTSAEGDQRLYDLPFLIYDEELDVVLPPGELATGALTFLVDSDDTNLRLRYYPATVLQEEPYAVFRLPPSAEE